MKAIKFNLAVDGVKIGTVEELRDHFTTEILDHFRTGLLQKWLRSRDLTAELEAVEALPGDGSDEKALLALCELFDVDADQQTIAAALAEATGVPAVRVADGGDDHAGVAQFDDVPAVRVADGGDGQVEREIVVGSERRAKLLPGHRDQWRLDIPAGAALRLEAQAEREIALTLSDERGQQLMCATVQKREATPVHAYFPTGRYGIQVTGGEEECNYRLSVYESGPAIDPAEGKVALRARGQTTSITEGENIFGFYEPDFWEIFAAGCGVTIADVEGLGVSLGEILDGNLVAVLRRYEDSEYDYDRSNFGQLYGQHFIQINTTLRTTSYSFDVTFIQIAEAPLGWCALTKFATGIRQDRLEDLRQDSAFNSL